MTNLSKQLQSVLDRDMDRKEFIRLAGAAVLGVIGVSKLLGALGNLDKPTAKATNSYGSSPYGR